MTRCAPRRPDLPSSGGQVRRAPRPAGRIRSADAVRARLCPDQPAGDRAEFRVLARRAALLLPRQGRPDHPLRPRVQGPVRDPVRPDRGDRHHRRGAGHRVRRRVSPQTMVQDAHLHRLWYDLRSQSMFEASFRDDVAEIDSSLERMIWRIVSQYAELTGRPPTVSPATAYAIFDGLFQHGLIGICSATPMRRRTPGDGAAHPAHPGRPGTGRELTVTSPREGRPSHRLPWTACHPLTTHHHITRWPGSAPRARTTRPCPPWCCCTATGPMNGT